MPSKNITFDPDSGVPYGLNLTIYGGSDFTANLNVKTTSSGNFNLTDYSGSALNAISWLLTIFISLRDEFFNDIRQ